MLNDDKRLCCYECEERYEARIASLEAELAALKMVDADMEDGNGQIWSAEIKLPPSKALASAREAGARTAFDWLWENAAIALRKPRTEEELDELNIDVAWNRLARFLAPVPAPAEGEREEGGK